MALAQRAVSSEPTNHVEMMKAEDVEENIVRSQPVWFVVFFLNPHPRTTFDLFDQSGLDSSFNLAEPTPLEWATKLSSAQVSSNLAHSHENSGSYQLAFQLYLETARTYLYLVRTCTNAVKKAELKSCAKELLERAERIKKAGLYGEVGGQNPGKVKGLDLSVGESGSSLI